MNGILPEQFRGSQAQFLRTTKNRAGEWQKSNATVTSATRLHLSGALSKPKGRPRRLRTVPKQRSTTRSQFTHDQRSAVYGRGAGVGPILGVGLTRGGGVGRRGGVAVAVGISVGVG